MTWFLPPHRGVHSGLSEVDQSHLTRISVPEHTLTVAAKLYVGGIARVIATQYHGRDFAYAPELIGEYRMDRYSRDGLRWALAQAATQHYLDGLS